MKLLRCVCVTVSALLLAAAAPAQISFSAAVNQALANSPRVKTAQDDLTKARASLAVMKDIFVPSVVVGAGLGTAYGITLGVPTIFTVTAQSLVYSPQQRSYIRSGHLDLKAAQLALDDARDQVAEDAANTYLTLNHDQAAVAALTDQFGYQLKLVDIVQDRVNAHFDNELDLKKARRDALQMRLQLMQMQDDLNSQRAHLAALTGIAEDSLTAQADTIPDLPPMPDDAAQSLPDGPGILAAEANQQAREIRARGDAQYTWKPIVSFGGQYGRVSPIENVSEFYNLHGNYNSASIGVQIQLPVLDRVRAAAARQSAADAAHGAIDMETQKLELADGRRKLQRAASELTVKAQLADLDYGIADDELQSVLIALHASNGGPPLTPKDEQNARIQERQKYLEMLDTRLDASRAEISYMRQAGQLQGWLQSLAPTATHAR